jgi:hypothetical protein
MRSGKFEAQTFMIPLKKCGDLSYAGNVVCPRLRPFDLRCDLDDTPLVLSETIPNEKRRGPTTLMNRYAVWG